MRADSKSCFVCDSERSVYANATHMYVLTTQLIKVVTDGVMSGTGCSISADGISHATLLN